MDSSIEKLFAGYEKAFSTFDAGAATRFFADKFMAADPNNVRVFGNNLLFLLGAKKGAAGYKKLGMNSVRTSLSETPISDQYTLVTVHYGVKFRKTGDRLVEFDVSYLVSKIGPEPKIILFISHEDEQKTMRELGII